MQQSSLGRKRRLVGAACLLVVSVLCAGPALAEESGSFHFDLVVNVIGMDTDGAGLEAPIDFDLAGLPVSIAAQSGGADTNNPGISAGLNGEHALSLGAGFTLATHGNLQKTRYLTDSFFGSDRIAGGTALQFTDSGFRGAIEPGIDLDLSAGALDRRRYAVNGRLSQDILDGWTVSLGNGWARQQHPGSQDDNADTGTGSLGFAFTMIDRTKINLGYDMSRTWAARPEDAAKTAGPALGLSVSLLDALDIDLRYQYCQSTDIAAADGGLRALVDTTHAVGINALWLQPGAEYLTISAGYNFDRTTSAVADRDGITHDGMINLGLKF